MPPDPNFTNVLLSIASTWPGKLVLAGILVALASFFLPHLFPNPEGWRETETRIQIFDWSFSLAYMLIGSGILLVETKYLRPNLFAPSGYRYAISGLFFAIAGRRVLGRLF